MYILTFSMYNYMNNLLRRFKERIFTKVEQKEIIYMILISKIFYL